MIHCKALNKNFESKSDMFKELREAREQIISEKKAKIYKSCEKGVSVTSKPIDISKVSGTIKELFNDTNYYYIATNTTRILDSHEDLHINGLWNKSAKEQTGKNYFVADHELRLVSTIVRKEHVSIFIATIPFSLLGKNYDGDTEALIYKFKKDKVIHKVAKEWLDSGDAIEASVRMQYIDIEFALNSDADEDKREKKVFDKYYPIIANKEDFDDNILYFWAVKQAKNTAESSLVIMGSNPVTGEIQVNEDKQKPPEGTSEKIEPEKSTQKGIDYNYLRQNLKFTK